MPCDLQLGMAQQQSWHILVCLLAIFNFQVGLPENISCNNIITCVDVLGWWLIMFNLIFDLKTTIAYSMIIMMAIFVHQFPDGVQDTSKLFFVSLSERKNFGSKNDS